MSKRCGLFMALAVVVCAQAQNLTIPQAANVKGRLQSTTDNLFHGYVVELSTMAARTGDSPRVDVEVGGDFTFRGVPYGEYLLKVLTVGGDPVMQQFVSINERFNFLEVHMPVAAQHPTGKTISVKELQHPPARKALEACVAAQHFAESGHFAEAAEELQKAIRISPEFAPAHANLGVQYLRMQRFEQANTEISRAIEIGGPNPRDLSNLAFAQAGLQRLPDAIASAKAALQIDHNNASAHYVLGTLLMGAPETRGEGIAHLEVAARTLEPARKALEELNQ